MTRSVIRWGSLALLGMLVAGAVALLATRAVSTSIGISSESIDAGRALAPSRTTTPPAQPRPSAPSQPDQAPATTVPVPVQPAANGDDRADAGGDD